MFLVETMGSVVFTPQIKIIIVYYYSPFAVALAARSITILYPLRVDIKVKITLFVLWTMSLIDVFLLFPPLRCRFSLELRHEISDFINQRRLNSSVKYLCSKLSFHKGELPIKRK